MLLIFLRFSHETHFQTLKTTPRAQIWFPQKKFYCLWAQGHQGPSPEGPLESHRVRAPQPGEIIDAVRLDAQRRIRKQSEFTLLRTEGKRLTFVSYVFQWLATERPTSRVGVIASKRVGNAVMRALAKRRLRAFYMRHAHNFNKSVDLVLVARRHLIDKPFKDTETQFLAACRKAGLIDESVPSAIKE